MCTKRTFSNFWEREVIFFCSLFENEKSSEREQGSNLRRQQQPEPVEWSERLISGQSGWLGAVAVGSIPALAPSHFQFINFLRVLVCGILLLITGVHIVTSSTGGEISAWLLETLEHLFLLDVYNESVTGLHIQVRGTLAPNRLW